MTNSNTAEVMYVQDSNAMEYVGFYIKEFIKEFYINDNPFMNSDFPKKIKDKFNQGMIKLEMWSYNQDQETREFIVNSIKLLDLFAMLYHALAFSYGFDDENEQFQELAVSNTDEVSQLLVSISSYVHSYVGGKTVFNNVFIEDLMDFAEYLKTEKSSAPTYNEQYVFIKTLFYKFNNIKKKIFFSCYDDVEKEPYSYFCPINNKYIFNNTLVGLFEHFDFINDIIKIIFIDFLNPERIFNMNKVIINVSVSINKHMFSVFIHNVLFEN